MPGIVIYGVGSPIVVDIEESITRSGNSIAAAIQNVPGKDFLLDKTKLINIDALPVELVSQPFIVGLFTPGNRLIAAQEAKGHGFWLPHSLIDASVPLPRALTYGPGLYVNSGCTLGAASQFDEFVFINRGACIGHHVRLGAFVSIGPGAVVAGLVHVGRGAVVGAGATVLPELTIGSNSVVGAGAVVTRDVPDNCLVFGNPARVVKQGIPGYKDKGIP